MSVEFPLNKVRTPLGIVADPMVSVEILTRSGYRFFDLLLDTGADCSMLPKFMAQVIGIDLSECKSTTSFGIEGKGVTVHIGKIDIKLGKYPLKIKCLFSEEETTPFLLGRIDIFPQFNLIFDNRHQKILLHKI